MKIAILGAEVTGKTTLLLALAGLLKPAHPSLVCVPEYLHAWCDTHGRNPRAEEQAHFMQMQMQGVGTRPSASLVLSDTAPLMTAIYSDLIFDDPSLYTKAAALHRTFDLTLVAGLDLPCAEYRFQRDGVDLRARVNQRLRDVLALYGIAFSTVYGRGEARSQSAMQAIGYALGKRPPDAQRSHWKWPCEKCSDPACEHRLFSDLLESA
jgi:nicotinamide riboside kinase